MAATDLKAEVVLTTTLTITEQELLALSAFAGVSDAAISEFLKAHISDRSVKEHAVALCNFLNSIRAPASELLQRRAAMLAVFAGTHHAVDLKEEAP